MLRSFLDRACVSARGLLQFFEMLQSEEMLNGDSADQWTQTHPLTSERIEYVRDQSAHARCSDTADSPQSVELLRAARPSCTLFSTRRRARSATTPKATGPN